MRKLLFSLLFLAILLTTDSRWGQAQALTDRGVPGSVALAGDWRLIEQACVGPNHRIVIGPGFPGPREEWLLSFQKAEPRGLYSFSAIYLGISGQDCRLSLEGQYQTQVDGAGNLVAIKFTPQKSSVKKAGAFEPPCRIFSQTRSQLFEARRESSDQKTGARVERLRFLGTDTEKRCTSTRERMELLFESL